MPSVGLTWDLLANCHRREYYRRAGGFKLDNPQSRVMSLALTPSEECVYAATHDNQLLRCALIDEIPRCSTSQIPWPAHRLINCLM